MKKNSNENTYFNASMGNLQPAIFKCFKLKVLVKNCLNDGGISLPFFVLNELWETLRWAKCVAQPRKRAPNNYKYKTIWNIKNFWIYYEKFGYLHSLVLYQSKRDLNILKHLVVLKNCVNSVKNDKINFVKFQYIITHLETTYSYIIFKIVTT